MGTPERTSEVIAEVMEWARTGTVRLTVRLMVRLTAEVTARRTVIRITASAAAFRR